MSDGWEDGIQFEVSRGGLIYVARQTLYVSRR